MDLTLRLRKYRCTTDSGHALPVAPNVLARAFDAQAPNRAWVGDIAVIPTAQGWLCLAVLMDLFSRRVVGWAMAERIDRDPCLTALQGRWGTGNLGRACCITPTEPARMPATITRPLY